MCVFSCVWLCNPMDCRPPNSSAHGIFQARILEQVVISYSKGSPLPRDQTHVSNTSPGSWRTNLKWQQRSKTVKYPLTELCQTAQNNYYRVILWEFQMLFPFHNIWFLDQKENYTVLWFSWSSGGSRTFTNSTFTWISTPNIKATLNRMSCNWRIPVRKEVERDELSLTMSECLLYAEHYLITIWFLSITI